MNRSAVYKNHNPMTFNWKCYCHLFTLNCLVLSPAVLSKQYDIPTSKLEFDRLNYVTYRLHTLRYWRVGVQSTRTITIHTSANFKVIALSSFFSVLLDSYIQKLLGTNVCLNEVTGHGMNQFHSWKVKVTQVKYAFFVCLVYKLEMDGYQLYLEGF